jgi:hypothetical protein
MENRIADGSASHFTTPLDPFLEYIAQVQENVFYRNVHFTGEYA